MPITQQAAGELLRRNAPPGEFPAFINSREASWLRGMGGKGKKTKSVDEILQIKLSGLGKKWGLQDWKDDEAAQEDY